MACAVTETAVQPKWQEVQDNLNEKLGEAMFGDITAAEAVTQAAAEGEEIIDES
jgi:multiple sugar transport system substrate-binding protein